MDGEKIVSTEQEVEPLYGEPYLPRKFKSGLAIEGDNCIDVYSQDIGMVAHIDDGKLAGFTVLVGGGMGMTHGHPETYPFSPSLSGLQPESSSTELFMTIIEVQRDNGRRDDRRRARMKYLVEDLGY